MSRDPFPGYDNLPASQNGYNYTHANPVNYTDPTGHCIELVSGAICVGTGVIVVGTVAIVGGTVIAVNNIVNDRPALDFSGMPPAPDWMVDNFYVLDDLQQWIENYPLLENSAPYFGSFPLLHPQLNIPTGFDLIEDSCWLEQFSPSPQTPRLPGFNLQQNIGLQILMATSGKKPGYSGPAGGYTNKRPNDLNIGLGLQNRMLIEELFASHDFDRPSNLLGADGVYQGTNKYIYVIDGADNIWISRPGNHHADLVGGANTYGAGEMYIDRSGHIRLINNQSGHYLPGEEFFPHLKSLLENKGLTIDPNVFDAH